MIRSFQSTQLYGNAASGLALVGERLQRSPVARPLRARLRILELVALAWLDGEALDIDRAASAGAGAYNPSGDLLRWGVAFGQPMRLASLVDPAEVMEWLGFSMPKELDPWATEIIGYRSVEDVAESVR